MTFNKIEKLARRFENKYAQAVDPLMISAYILPIVKNLVSPGNSFHKKLEVIATNAANKAAKGGETISGGLYLGGDNTGAEAFFKTVAKLVGDNWVVTFAGYPTIQGSLVDSPFVDKLALSSLLKSFNTVAAQEIQKSLNQNKSNLKGSEISSNLMAGNILKVEF